MNESISGIGKTLLDELGVSSDLDSIDLVVVCNLRTLILAK